MVSAKHETCVGGPPPTHIHSPKSPAPVPCSAPLFSCTEHAAICFILSICSPSSQHLVTHNPLHYSTYSMHAPAGTMRCTNTRSKYLCISTAQIIFQLNLGLPQTTHHALHLPTGSLICQSVHGAEFRNVRKQHVHYLQPGFYKSHTHLYAECTDRSHSFCTCRLFIVRSCSLGKFI